MPFIPKVWKNKNQGPPYTYVTAEELNRIEQGIADAAQSGGGASDTQVAALVSDPASETKTALDGTYAPIGGDGFEVNLMSGQVPGAAPIYRDTDIQRAFNARTARIGPGVWHVSGQIRADSGCNVTLDGATIVSHYVDGSIIEQAGTTPDVSPRTITAGATLDSTILTVSTIDLSVGDWVFIRSSDLQENDSTASTGILRRIVASDATTITIDSPLYRALPTSPVLVKVTFAPTLNIGGVGTLTSAVPANSKKAMVHSFFGWRPQLGQGVTVANHGGPGFEINNCVDAISRASYTDLINDASAGNYGYGVNDGGASRGTRVLGGTATRIRHGYTTNSASRKLHSSFPGDNYGEPEDFYVGAGFTVIGGSDAGFDTHPPGRRGVIEVSSVSCAIGAQDRATNTTFIVKQIYAPRLYGMHIAASSSGCVVAGLQVVSPSATPNSGAALVRTRAPVTLVTPQCLSAPSGWVGIKAEPAGDVTIAGGGYIAGTREGSAKLKVVSLDGKSASIVPAEVTDLRAAFAALGIAPSTGNLALALGPNAAFSAGDVTAAGAAQGRILRGVATNAADIVCRFDGVAGHTGDLFQARVNGSNRFIVGAVGDAELPVAGKGLILRSPDGTRYRLTVANGGAIGTAAI